MKLFEISKDGKQFKSVYLWNPLPLSPVFGGQIVSQALNAAYESVSNNSNIHSLHSYFLSLAKIDKPIQYIVETNRDGNTVENRYIKAIQGDLKFTMTASFTKGDLTGKSNQNQQVTNESYVLLSKILENLDPKYLDHFSFLSEYVTIYKGESSYKFVIREKIKGREMACLLAFISDLFLLESALGIMNEQIFSQNIQKLVSVDHSVYFHKSCDDDVLIFESKWINMNQGGCLCQGYIFDSGGKHIATAMQEGIIKLKEKKEL